MKRLSVSIMGAVMVVLLSLSMVSAGTSIFDNTVSDCSTDNCSSLTLAGSVFTINDIEVRSWVVNLFSDIGQCMRFEVLAQDTDLEMVVVAPNGQVFRDDDSAGDRRPLVKIASALNVGWYTVQVSSFDGMPPALAISNFVFSHGVYTPGNANCASATSPLSIDGLDDHK
ncbi:hypothetical protein C2W62_04275 [Candidatus Entotheonella serta]|nr:hypothetical protein C2W62_04275 [Candidatus Entotheonella serta]